MHVRLLHMHFLLVLLLVGVAVGHLAVVVLVGMRERAMIPPHEDARTGRMVEDMMVSVAMDHRRMGVVRIVIPSLHGGRDFGCLTDGHRDLPFAQCEPTASGLLDRSPGPTTKAAPRGRGRPRLAPRQAPWRAHSRHQA